MYICMYVTLHASDHRSHIRYISYVVQLPRLHTKHSSDYILYVYPHACVTTTAVLHVAQNLMIKAHKFIYVQSFIKKCLNRVHTYTQHNLIKNNFQF